MKKIKGKEIIAKIGESAFIEEADILKGPRLKTILADLRGKKLNSAWLNLSERGKRRQV